MSAVLGIWDGHDASISLVVDGALVFALSEERPSRRKRYSGFPALALDACLRWADDAGIDVGAVALAGAAGRAPLRALERLYSSGDTDRDPLDLASSLVRGWENTVPRVPGLRAVERRAGLAWVARRLRRRNRWPEVPIHTVAHHEAHAWSALLGARDEPGLVVTWDAYGEGVALTARTTERPGEPSHQHGPDVGLARVYGAVTKALGFREGDEGKVMGLAAHGDPSVALARFGGLFEVGAETPRLRRRLTHRVVRELVAGLSREDTAAALQATSERAARDWVARRVQEAGPPRRLLLAGGLFANIRVNQTLADLPGVSGVFVFPNMVDGGLSAGAAARVWTDLGGGPLAPLGGTALGLAATAREMEAACREAGVPWQRVADPEARAAEHLRAGRTVCRYNGRDEFGPRALGNRSILVSADDATRGVRLNEALGRDGFMPFGPMIRAEDLDQTVDTELDAADLRYMTVSVDATDALREACPLAVHIDGTTRPQVVSQADSPALHRLLTRYRELGGTPAVVNTSFNLHGEPIVHTPGDALRTFQRAGLDVLLLGDLEIRPS